jgi:adenosine deaminase
MTKEYYRAVEHYNLSLSELQTLVINGFKSSFLSYSQKSEILQEAVEETERQLFKQGLNAGQSL